MSDLKDASEIKLFGKTISLPVPQLKDQLSSSSSSSANEDFADTNNSAGNEQQLINTENSRKEAYNDKQENCTDEDSSKDPTKSSQINEKPKTSSAETEKESSNTKNGEQNESSDSQEKPLKKPDKIIPCPRCNSMDTKFCYYNNYNVNQPRHFCKNCQRYWTAGGTMRNVPVGAGRRKNKNTNYRQLMVPEAFKTAQIANNGSTATVLNFGSSAADSTLCESVASVLNLSDKTSNHFPNEYKYNNRSEQRNHHQNGDDRLSGSSITVSTPSNMQETVTYAPRQVACFKGPPWPYSTTYCHSGFPVSFYPAPAYWGPWNLASLNALAPCSNPGSPLGKHSREGKIIINCDNYEEESERNVMVKKAVKIDDANEAANSSVWAKLGMKNEKSNFDGGGFFKGFQSKNIEEKNHICADKSSAFLQANPAALSRSLNFHEST